MDYEIVPLQGAGPLRFGMAAAEVAALLGEPEQVSHNHLAQRVEFRGPLTLGYADREGSALNHIAFGPQARGVRLGGLRPFEQEDRAVVQGLLRLDHTAGTYLGFAVFPRLGVALTGLHDNDTSQRAVTLFPPGAWDKRIAKLVPMHP
jgi:hypothetical protein